MLIVLFTLVLLGYVLIQNYTLDQQLAEGLKFSSMYDDAYAEAELTWQSNVKSWRKSVEDPEKYLGHTVSLDTAKATLFVAEAKVIECQKLQQAYRNLTAELEKKDREAIASARMEVAEGQCSSYLYSNEHYDSWVEAMPDYSQGISERIADLRSYDNYLNTEMEYNAAQLQFLELVDVEGSDAPISSADMTGANALYQIMNQILPILLPVYIVLLCHDTISGERRDGSEALVLLQPIDRKRIYLMKYAANCLMTIAAVAFPLLLVIILASVMNGEGSWSYPMLMDIAGLTGFDALPLLTEAYEETLRMFNDYGFVEQYAMGLSAYSPWDISRSLLMAIPNPMLKYVPLGSYLLWSVPLWLLNSCWLTALTQLISSVFHARTGSISALALIVAGVCFCAPSGHNVSFLMRLIPFFYLNPLKQLTGIGASTVLTGEIVTLATCLICSAVGVMLYGRISHHRSNIRKGGSRYAED